MLKRLHITSDTDEQNMPLSLRAIVARGRVQKGILRRSVLVVSMKDAAGTRSRKSGLPWPANHRYAAKPCAGDAVLLRRLSHAVYLCSLAVQGTDNTAENP